MVPLKYNGSTVYRQIDCIAQVTYVICFCRLLHSTSTHILQLDSKLTIIFNSLFQRQLIVLADYMWFRKERDTAAVLLVFRALSDLGLALRFLLFSLFNKKLCNDANCEVQRGWWLLIYVSFHLCIRTLHYNSCFVHHMLLYYLTICFFFRN